MEIKWNLLVFRLIVFLLFLVGCSETRLRVSEESDFIQYINGFTSGQISKYSSVNIRLSKPVSGVEAGASLKNGIVKLSPQVQGNAFWVDSTTIEFKPDKPLKSNQEYFVEFRLSEVRKVPKKLETFVFNFCTIKQSITVETDFPIISENGNVFFNGRLLLTDKEEIEEIQKTVTVCLGEKKWPVEWKNFRRNDIGYEYNFSISGFHQTKNDQEIYLKWNGTIIGSEEQGENKLIIPGSGFRMIGSKVHNGEDAHIQLYFSTPLQSLQDYGSLCYFSDSEVKTTYVQDENLLEIYPSNIFFDEKTLVVDPNLCSHLGEKLDSANVLSVKFENLKPAVRLISKGVIFPDSKGTFIPFQTVNLKAVDVYILKIFEDNVLQFLQTNGLDGDNEMKRVARPIKKKTIRLDKDKYTDLSKWNTFSVDLSELVHQEPGAIYRAIFRFKKSYSTYPCGEESLDSENEVSEDELWDESIYDGSYYDFYYRGYSNYDDQYYGDDFWKNRGNPCHSSYYQQSNRSAQTNLLASNLGIIVKSGENNHFFTVVTNLLTATPESDADVLFYNYQRQVIGKGKTDNNGFLEIPLDKKPYFIEVIKGNQKGYLRLDDGSSLSLSNFDVSGEQYKKGLKGYIYGERGVWRPGDTLHLTFVLQDEDQALPQSHPITMELKNPKNQLYSRMVQKKNDMCFYTFHIPTTNDVLTGQWSVKIQVGGASFSKTLWIETVKPNRLKIILGMNTNIIRSGSVPKFTLNSVWLQGAVAANKQADVRVKYRKGKTVFSAYGSYIFESPVSNMFTSEEKVLFDGKTDGNGKAEFTKEMPKAFNAPGMLQAEFTTRVFEGDGDFSINYETVNYSPYNSYVGLKLPISQNKEGILYTDKNQKFNIVLVDEDGKLVNSDNIQFSVYKLDWRWWWDSGRQDDLAYYVNNTYAKKYFYKDNISTKNGKAEVTVNIPKTDWGRYLICVKNAESGHQTGAVVYFDWEDWLGRSGKDNPNGATMLTFSTDKEKYDIGEKVRVTIPSSENGRALVTVENRSRVICAQWINTQQGSSSFEIEVTPEMAPNVYVYISLLQPHANTKNDLPIRLYGVKNITVEDKNTHLYPIIKMPDKVEPEKQFKINVSEKNGTEMSYTLAIVDEGLLDITNFKTPDVHAAFYSREALGVNTWDMFDYVVGAYGGKIEQLFGIGGDMSLRKSDQDKTNSRFKPVVKFIGPYTLKAGKTDVHEITLPSYFGSVRVMVVAGNCHAYGNTEKTVKVQKPLMVLATLPRVAGLNEHISLPVNVFAMDASSKNVTVSVSSGKILKVIGESNKHISFDKSGDKVVTFDLQAGNNTGKEKIKIKANNGTSQAEYEVTLEVRNSNPRMTESKSFSLAAGEKLEYPYSLIGVSGTNVLSMEVARVPSLNLETRLEYLIDYPHGCAEQIISKGFPQLYLPSLLSLSAKENKESEDNIKSVILKLTQLQRSDGAVLYWNGGNYTYDWVTSYAGHFMLEARDKGFSVPVSFLNLWADYQKQKAQTWSSERVRKDYKKYNLDDLEQAYRLYTLALYGKPELGAMNRLRETGDISAVAVWRLAGAYLLVGKPEIARKLIAGISEKTVEYSSFNNTFGSSLRDDAMILEVLTLLKQKQDAFALAQKISEQLNSNDWYSTQSTSYALIAMSKFISLVGADKNIEINYSQNGNSFKKQTKTPVFRTFLDAKKQNNGVISVENTGEGELFITFANSGVPSENKVLTASNGIIMEIRYEDLSGNPVDIRTLHQGTDFVAEVMIQNSSSYETYKEMSLTQIFPSGWEIINSRMQEANSVSNGNLFTYQDIKDDRVLTYFDLNPKEIKRFKMQLNAAYVGQFYLPAVLCEAMYDSKIYARKQGLWVNVNK